MILSFNLKWNKHVEVVSNEFSKNLGIISKIRHILPLKTWMSSNRLRLNADKTQFIWLGTSHFLGKTWTCRLSAPSCSRATSSTILESTCRLWARHGSSGEQTMSSLLLSPASVANSASIAHQGIATHISPRLRYKSGRSLQRSPVRVSFLSSRQASVRVELGHSAGPEHPQVQPHISCHPRRAPLASNQKKDQLQDRSYGPPMLGWCCAGIPDGTVPSCWLSRRSTMYLVGFSW